jgi:hypothetical protein
MTDRPNYEPPARLRRYVGIALQGHAKMLRTNGVSVPDGFDAYVDRLLLADRNGVTRSNALAAVRMRRYRARKKAQRAA